MHPTGPKGQFWKMVSARPLLSIADSRRSASASVTIAVLLLGMTPLAVSAFSNGEAASVVLGQVDFTHNGVATNRTGMSFPRDVAFDSSGNVWVADTLNNRFLEFLLNSYYLQAFATA